MVTRIAAMRGARIRAGADPLCAHTYLIYAPPRHRSATAARRSIMVISGMLALYAGAVSRHRSYLYPHAGNTVAFIPGSHHRHHPRGRQCARPSSPPHENTCAGGAEAQPRRRSAPRGAGRARAHRPRPATCSATLSLITLKSELAAAVRARPAGGAARMASKSTRRARRAIFLPGERRCASAPRAKPELASAHAGVHRLRSSTTASVTSCCPRSPCSR